MADTKTKTTTTTTTGDNTYVNIFSFIILTVAYFAVIKPKLTIDILYNKTDYLSYTKNSQIMVMIYFMLVMLIQFGLNTSTVMSKCGGSATSNMATAAMLTFVPWLFIFGMVIVALILFPGFKGAFSDVLGYFAVAGSANSLLTELLVDPDINNKIEKETADEGSSPEVQSGGARETRQDMQNAADAIIKLFGNMSILINQIVPGNFAHYWQVLQPLFKDKFRDNLESAETLAKQQALLDLVVIRDNIGEAFWYIYTAILLISIVQFNITTQPCSTDPNILQNKYTDYLAQQATAAKDSANAKATLYASG